MTKSNAGAANAPRSSKRAINWTPTDGASILQTVLANLTTIGLPVSMSASARAGNRIIIAIDGLIPCACGHGIAPAGGVCELCELGAPAPDPA